MAGEVVALGTGTHRFAEGDRVMAVVGGGGQAELALVHERAAMPVPERLDWPQAGGLPEVFTTAHDALFTPGRAAPGRAPARPRRRGRRGHRGRAARPRAGARVTATVRREELRPQVEQLGARAIAPEGFVEHGPYDVILELVGAGNLDGQPRLAGAARADRRDRGRRQRPRSRR